MCPRTMSKFQGPINQKAVIAYCYQDKAYKQALELAKALYKKKKRKYTGVDYLSHPLTVASLLLEAKVSSFAMVVSALQDVLTQSNLKISTVANDFGQDVADAVTTLTPIYHPDGQLHLAAYVPALMAASPELQTIKLASLLDEICSIPAGRLVHEAGFLFYAAEIASALDKGDAELKRRVSAAIRRAHA